MPDCHEVGSRLGRFLDGELPTQDSTAVEAHIRGSPVCQRELGALRSLSASFDTVAAPPVPEAVLGEIMARVRDERRASRVPFSFLESWRTWPVAMRLSAAGVAAAACLIGVIAGSALSRPPSRTDVDTAWVALSAGSVIASAHLETVR